MGDCKICKLKTFKNYSYCEKHYTEYIELNKQYEVKEFSLVHMSKNYDDILKSGFIMSPRYTNKYRFNYGPYITDEIKDRIFVSLLYPQNDDKLYYPCNNIEDLKKSKFNEAIFVFDISLLQDYIECKTSKDKLYITPGWAWGFYEPSIHPKYNNKKSLKKNLNNWRLKTINEDSGNEIIIKASKFNDECIRGKISLEKYLKYIIINKDLVKDLQDTYPMYKFITI